MPSLLVVDDDRSVQHLVRTEFQDDDVEVLTAESEADGLRLVKQREPDVVLLDMLLPGSCGIETYQRIHILNPRLPVVCITAGGNSDTAIEAIKLGAVDFLFKPLDLSKVRALVWQSLKMRRLMAAQPSAPEHFAVAGDRQLIGRSPSMIDVYKAIGRVAPQDVSVLIGGESGCGKELIAKAIYHHSLRRGKPFLAVSCAAIPDALLESELFGHERGAFTGADQRRIGKFEQCTGGTIFLDEVGDMSPLVQSKLLRLLQEQRFERVGGNETITTDVRIIAATHRNLEEMTAAGLFRSDLFYRLNGFAIMLPPLRERGDDIALLIDAFLPRYSRELGKEVQRVSPEALQRLVEYPWPGNVRELQSVLCKGLLHATGSVLMTEFLPAEVRDGPRARHSGAQNGSLASDLGAFFADRMEARSDQLYSELRDFMERYVVTRVLQLTAGNRSRAADLLGITRGALRMKIQNLGITIVNSVQVVK